MLTTAEQITILKLAKSLARAHVMNATHKDSAARMGEPANKYAKIIKRAEANLLDYMKESQDA